MISQINFKLVGLNGKLPSNFVQQPRMLRELDRWKTTELHIFLLYTGIVALKGTVDTVVYKHFISFSVAIRLLCESNACVCNLNLKGACQFLSYFVVNSQKIFEELFCVYNVHSLLLLCDDVLFYNVSLDIISSFKFENYLQKLKQLVRNKCNPLVQRDWMKWMM